MTTQGVKKPVSTDEKKEIAALKAKIAELERMQREIPEVYEVPESDSKIDSNSYVRVMSLLPFNLNLSRSSS